MVEPIHGAGAFPVSPGEPAAAPQTGAAGGKSFKDFLSDSLSEVNQLQHQAERAIETFATGGDTNMAEVLTAVQKADMAFRTLMQIRNKLVSAYDEVRQMRVG